MLLLWGCAIPSMQILARLNIKLSLVVNYALMRRLI